MFENSDAFGLFISDLLDEKVKTLPATDAEYRKARAAANQAFEALSRDFNSREINIIEDFQGLHGEVYAIENRFLYHQGYLDCVKLLKTLGVLV